jgi:hypothetical protein
VETGKWTGVCNYHATCGPGERSSSVLHICNIWDYEDTSQLISEPGFEVLTKYTDTSHLHVFQLPRWYSPGRRWMPRRDATCRSKRHLAGRTTRPRARGIRTGVGRSSEVRWASFSGHGVCSWTWWKKWSKRRRSHPARGGCWTSSASGVCTLST